MINNLASQIFYDKSDYDENYDPKRDMIIKEIQPYKILFFKGDTLTYRVESHDSIIVDFNDALVKTRFEMHRVICDSVSRNGLFHLRITLIDYIADEWKRKIPPVRRTAHPWIGRDVYLTMDSLGRRHGVGIDDTTLYAMSPGGAFQPQIFVPFSNTYKFINESWSVNTLDTLAENGLPFPMVKRSFLFRGEHPIDTLGHESIRFRYITTGTGAVTVIAEDTKLRTDAVLNGGGNMILSVRNLVPVHHFSNVEQKMNIKYPDGTEMPIWHYNSTDFTLDTFKPGAARTAYMEKLKSTHEKQSKSK